MQIPKNWKEVTIGQFIQAYDAILNEELDIIDKNIMLLGALTGKPAEHFEALPLDRFKELVAGVQFLNDLSTIDTRVPVVIRIGKRIFDVCTEPSRLTGGQYIDLNSILSQCSSQHEINSRMHELMAIICIPRKYWLRKGKYNGAMHKEIADLLYERLSMATAYPILLFFCKLWQYLTPVIETYLAEEGRQMLKEVMKNLSLDMPKNGGGSL